MKIAQSQMGAIGDARRSPSRTLVALHSDYDSLTGVG